MRYAAWLALRSARARRGSGLAAGLGVAVAAAVLAVILVGTTVARDRSITQVVERLPASSQAVRAVWFGVPAGPDEDWQALDRSARRALTSTPLPDPVSIVLVRESTIGGRFVGLAAVDGLGPHVRLGSGRLPRTCRPARCEVVRLRGSGDLPDVPGLRIVEVGRGTLASPRLFGDFLEPGDSALGAARLAPAIRTSGRYHSPPPAPLVVAEGVAGLVAAAPLARSYRSYAWVAPLGAGVPRAWGVKSMLRDVAVARTRLSTESSSWSVVAPAQELLAADRAATVTGRRLMLVGGEGVALLVAFALLAAGGIRRDRERARQRLAWSGATRVQTAWIGFVESALIGAGGALVGLGLGLALGALEATVAGAPVAGILRASILSPAGLALGVGLAVAATLLIWLAAELPRGGGRVGAGELALGAAMVAIVAISLGGQLDERRLAEGGGSGALLLALPGLVALVAAVAVARVVPWLVRPLARTSGHPALRIAATSVTRRSGVAGVAVAFLVLAVGLALFAETYRSTLVRGERDAAAFSVPAAFVVREDLSTLVPVLDAAPLDSFVRLARPGAVFQVARVGASAGRSETVSGVTLLGLPGEAVRRMPLWRGDWGLSRAELTALVARGSGTRLRGAPIVGDTLRMRVGPTLLGFRAVVRSPTGRVAALEAPPAAARRASVLELPVPAAFRSGRLIAVDLVPPRIVERGADAGTALRGALVLGIAGLDLSDWTGTGGALATPAADGDGLAVRFLVTPQRQARLRPRQATDTRRPAVAVTPALGELAGGVGGTLPLRVGGELVDLDVAAVVDRFPGVRGEAVIGNHDALSTAIATVSPVSARTNELWLDVAGSDRDRVAAALDRRPYRALDIQSRVAVEADARRDPLGHGTLVALGASAFVALLLAVIGLALSVRSDLRDERGELVDLEALGASPVLLRRAVRLRAAIILTGGVAGGVVAGVALAALVTRVIGVTARAGAAEPPLATTADPRSIVVAGVLLLLAAAVAVVAVTRAAFSDPRGPGRVGAGG